MVSGRYLHGIYGEGSPFCGFRKVSMVSIVKEGIYGEGSLVCGIRKVSMVSMVKDLYVYGI